MAPPGSHPGNQKSKAPSRLRGTSLVFVATILYLSAVFGTLYTLEVAYYTRQKADLLRNLLKDKKYMDDAKANAAVAEIRQYTTALKIGKENAASLESMRETTRKAMVAMFDATPHLTRLRLEDGDGHVIIEVSDLGRIPPQNDFSNSLLRRNFEDFASSTFGTNETTIAALRIYYTTAKGYPQIEALTAFYWKVLSLSMIVLLVIYYGLLRFILIPLQRVLDYMQRRTDADAAIIPVPVTQLERVYNDLARDAVLTRLSKELREVIQSSGVSQREPILRQIPDLIPRIIGITGCQVFTFHRKRNSDPWELERSFNSPVSFLQIDHFTTRLTEAISETDPSTKPEYWATRIPMYQDAQNAFFPYFSDILSVDAEHLALFVILVPPKTPPPNAWWADFYGRIAQELRYALSSIDEQRRLILQEKSKANVSLSRNLGHDLTNIIATSKLDLMTIRSLLAIDPQDLKKSPAKEQIFREALQGLLNNTRFLQEIVNIYRSFSYLQKPRFEQVDIAELVQNVVELYKLSVPRNFHVEIRGNNILPPTRVEPRLLRLALFNILTNASDAIKRSVTSANPNGQIIISTNFDAENSRIEMTVEDTGPGIRDEAGNLVPPESLTEIFQLGYSTKANQEGEGLGLNWVQTIVREFHGGDVLARNRDAGGAAFTIRLPYIPAPAEASAQTNPTGEST